MYISITGQYWIQKFYQYIVYPIGDTSQIYKYNQVIINRILNNRITHKAWRVDVLITVIHEHHPQKTFKVVDIYTYLQL